MHPLSAVMQDVNAGLQSLPSIIVEQYPFLLLEGGTLLQLSRQHSQPQDPLAMILAVQMILLIEAGFGHGDCHVHNQVRLSHALQG